MSGASSGEGAHTSEDKFYPQEVQLAFRNRGMPAEGLRMPITPTGMQLSAESFRYSSSRCRCLAIGCRWVCLERAQTKSR